MAQKKKLTPIGLNLAANTILSGVGMLEILNNVNLETDADGKIKQHVIRNLEMTMKVAAEMAPEKFVSAKFQKMREFLQDY